MAEKHRILPENWTDYIPLVSIIFFAGIFYNSQGTQDNDILDVKQRQEKKIKVQNDLDKRLKDLELYKAWEEGYREGYEKAKKENEE